MSKVGQEDDEDNTSIQYPHLLLDPFLQLSLLVPSEGIVRGGGLKVEPLQQEEMQPLRVDGLLPE